MIIGTFWLFLQLGGLQGFLERLLTQELSREPNMAYVRSLPEIIQDPSYEFKPYFLNKAILGSLGHGTSHPISHGQITLHMVPRKWQWGSTWMIS